MAGYSSGELQVFEPACALRSHYPSYAALPIGAAFRFQLDRAAIGKGQHCHLVVRPAIGISASFKISVDGYSYNFLILGFSLKQAGAFGNQVTGNLRRLIRLLVDCCIVRLN